MATGTNKKIAKNTLFLYVRMLMTMGISIYTSRVVLAALGETDFGIYNVVGGFVSMFSMISGALSAATQRFLSFELGKKENGRVSEIFSTAVMIHLLISLVILALAETIGLWFVNEKMNFPEERYFAANWVYQFSVITFLINIISVPYNAALVAYERMKAFAYVSIIEVILKLVVVYLLVLSPIDNLVFYALLLSIIAIFIRLIYGIYVKKNFVQCRCTYKINREVGKQMFSFMGWNMFGAGAIVANGQGVNVLLNIFFGTTVNAARGIVFQVQGAVRGFISNFQLAMAPQIIKNYAANNYKEMFSLVFNGSRFSFLLMMNLALPIIMQAPFIMKLWLVKVPLYTVVFLRIVLITSMVDSLGQTLSYAMHASGKVRNYQIVVGSSSLMVLPVVYLFLQEGCPPYYAFLVVLAFSFISLMLQLIMLRLSINFPMICFLKEVFARMFLVFFVAGIIPFLVNFLLVGNGWETFILISIITVLCSVLSSLFIGLSLKERHILKMKVCNFIKKFYDNVY